jgi:hypothetical protein
VAVRVWPLAGVKSDNRIANLREATPSQNMANRGLRKDSSPHGKCVYRNKHGTFNAYIYHDGRGTYLGAFQTAELARAAYLRAAETKWGEFAKVA